MQEAMTTRIQSQSESDLIPWAIQKHNPLIDKAQRGKTSKEEEEEK